MLRRPACSGVSKKKKRTTFSYTHRTPLAQSINLDWVESPPDQPALAEKIEAFVARLGRLQDLIDEKLIPTLLLDVRAFAEKMEWLNNAE
jgi:hypothetical protein